MLNDMRWPNIENIKTVKVSSDRQELVDYHNSLLVEPYSTDGKWGKCFKEGSELEWYNKGDMLEDNSYWGGIYTFSSDISDESLMAYSLKK